MQIQMKPIGYIKSPYKTLEEIPRQSVLGDKTAIIEILSKYEDGIQGIKEGSYGVILFYFHKSTGEEVPLVQVSHKTGEVTGVFNTRSPKRPNGIGMSIVQFKKVGKNFLEIQGVDMVDGTPVLDIKPYSQDLNPKT